MKVKALDESIIHDIGHAFAYYDYGTEQGLHGAFPSRDVISAFICGYSRMALKSGMLQAMNLKEMFRFFKIMSGGGMGLKERLNEKKQPYIYVGLVCVRERYQGQGYMRKVMDMDFAEGNRLGVPVILDTDARSKCDKYLHLGMELAGMRRFGEYGTLYDLIKYPDAKQGA